MGLKNFGFIADSFVVSTRNKFLQQYQKEISAFYPDDVQKVIKEDWYIKRFLILAYKNEENAVSLLIDALKWRKEYGIREIRDNDFPDDFYKCGGFFTYEKDINGIPTIYMRVEMLKKTPEIIETLKKFFIYTVFKVDEEANGNGWVIILDFTNCGYSAYEHLDLLRFMITTLHYYFPAGLDYAIVHHFPWVLKAFWNVVKFWIPPKRQEVIKFTYGDSITTYIDIDKLPDFLGGNCTTCYCNVPDGCLSSRDFGISVLGLNEESVNRLIDLYKPYLTK